MRGRSLRQSAARTASELAVGYESECNEDSSF